MSNNDQNSSSKIEDHSDQNDGNEFVPRFVKVFNESKMHEPRLPELTSAQSVDLYQKRMTDNSIMKTSPKHRDVKTTSQPYLEEKPLDEQRKSWKDGTSFSIDKSAFCKRTAMQMSLDSERRKKIVRTCLVVFRMYPDDIYTTKMIFFLLQIPYGTSLLFFLHDHVRKLICKLTTSLLRCSAAF